MTKSLSKKKQIAILTAISSLALLSGCGKTPDPAPGPGPGPGPGSIPAPVVGYDGGCIPVASATQISFNAMGATFMGNYELKAGALPVDAFSFQYMPETVGVVTMAAAGMAPPPPVPGGQILQGISKYTGAQVSLSITPTTQVAPINPWMPPQISGPVNVTGVINLGPVQGYLAMMANNNYYNQQGFPYPSQFPGYSPYQQMPPQMYPYPQGWAPTQAAPQTTTPTCISGVAIKLQRIAGTGQYGSSGMLGFGSIYLYMNGQPHGMSLPF